MSGAGVTPSLRVVLVGRTGLDASLRRDRGLTLQRAGTYLHAIGEVGRPIDDEPEGDDRSAAAGGLAVLVAPGAVPADELGAFTSAVRRLEPGAAVLSVGEPREGGGAFDGTVSRAADGAEVRRALAVRPARAASAANAPVPLASPGASGTPGTHAPTVISAPSRDIDPIDFLLRGEDILPSALGAVRRELNTESIEFVPAAGGSSPPRLLPDRALAEVRRRGHLFGWLVGPGESARTLSAWTGRFALWLAAEAQMRQLRHVAFTDSATGAKNGAYFERSLGAAMERARASRRGVGVILARVTRAEGVGGGTPSLDRVHRQAAAAVAFERLRRAAPSAIVCRLADLEFGIVVEGGAPGGANARAALGAMLSRGAHERGLSGEPSLELALGWSESPADGAEGAALVAAAESRLGAGGGILPL